MDSKNNDNTRYLTWLHELTTAGYDRDIVIPTEHSDAIQGIYALKGADDIERCLDHYEDFVRRWKALHEPGGDLYKGDSQDPVIIPEAIKYTNDEYLDLHGSADNAYIKPRITSSEYIELPENKRNLYMRFCGHSEVYYTVKP